MTSQKKATQDDVRGHGVLATVTVLTSDFGILTKEVYKDADGEPVKNNTPNFSGGHFQVFGIRSIKEFKKLRRTLKSNQAVMFSTPTSGITIGKITTKKRRFGRTLSRSLDCFSHPKAVGILALDYDPRSAIKPLTGNELYECIKSVVPAVVDTEVLWATSAGSCISDADTRKVVFGLKGQRIYILVTDGSDISRAIKVLATRLWLAGHGWIKVNKCGQMLDRTIVDLALANPVQPDFAAGAVCRPPYVQRSQDKLIGCGGPLNTRIAIPDLTPDESVQLDHLRIAAKALVADEAKAARESWLLDYADKAVKRAAAQGRVLTDEDRVEIKKAAVAALNENVLPGDFEIVLADRSILTVEEILANPAKYHGALCLEPLEPEYDDYRVVGKIFLDSNPSIHSFAYGGRTYKLCRQQSSVEWRVADSAVSVIDTIEVLRTNGSFYDYGNQLVHVVGVDIHVLTAATAIHYLGLQCRYWHSKVARSGTTKVNCDPHEKLVKQLLDLGARRGLRKLSATSDSPLILPDGTVIATNGYDTGTEIIFAITDPISIAEHPTIEQVRDALAQLWFPVSLFPYVDGQARTNCLAALLTAVVRKVIKASLGVAVDAPQRGTGKTKLARAILALQCGRHPDLSPVPTGQGREEELRKKITSTLLDGRDHILLDNAVGNFDSQAVAALMTSGHWSDRILGKSREFVGDARLFIGINGNNLSLSGELPRRFLQIRLDAGLENPFSRHFTFDPEELVLERRDQLVAAAITAIRGWFAAGAPGAATAGVGSFEEWGTLVRGPLLWFAEQGLLPFDGFCDPVESLVEAVENDSEHEELAEFLSALKLVIEGSEVTAKELLVLLARNRYDNEAVQIVRTFLEAHCRNGLTAQSVGKVLGYRRDRPAGGLKLVARKDRDKIVHFSVLPVAAG